MQTRTTLNTSQTSSSATSKVVELNGYVIILVQGKDGKIKLYGSPAEKDNLEVADEILDINERKLEDLPRAEVIRHIHECIQSCMIKLRVKRRSDSKLAGELGSVVQDAFVIAVEQQARERLQRLSALKRVTPVDMTLLSIKLNQQSSGEAGAKASSDFSFLKDVSPIYMASFERTHLNASNPTVAIAPAVSLAATTLSSATIPTEEAKVPDQQPKTLTVEPQQQQLQQQQQQQQQPTNTETISTSALTQNDHNDNNNQVANKNNCKTEIPTIEKTTLNTQISIQQPQQNNFQTSSSSSLSRKNSSNLPQPQVNNLQKPCIKQQQHQEIDSVSNFQNNFKDETTTIRSCSSTKSSFKENQSIPIDISATDSSIHLAQQRSFKRSSSNEPNGIQKKPLQYNLSQPHQPPSSIANTSIQQQQQQNNKIAVGNKDYSTLVYNSTAILHNLNNIRLSNGSTSNGKPDKCYNCMQNNIYNNTINATTEFQPDKNLNLECSCDLMLNNRQQSGNLESNIDGKMIMDHQSVIPKYQPYRMKMGPTSNLVLPTDDNLYANESGFVKLTAAAEVLKSQLNKRRLTVLSDRVFTALSLLSEPSISEAFHVRKIVSEILSQQINGLPVTTKSQTLSKDVTEQLSQCNSMHAIELANLLTSHEMEGLFLAHDKIAETANLVICEIDLEKQHQLQQHQQQQQQHQQLVFNKNLKEALNKQQNQNYPIVHSMHSNSISKPCVINNNNTQLNLQQQPEQGLCQSGLQDPNKQYTNDTSQNLVRLIHIEKSSEPLGATVRNEGDAVVIARIVRGGVAEKSGLLHEGDEILEVNNIKMRRKTVNEVCNLLGAMTGTLTFLIIPASSSLKGGGRESTILHVRAHFDYDPGDDLYIPCRELGLSFQKGDVLHVISRDDPNWWQAYREGEEDQNLAGLIPSQSFQHQRETMKLAIAEEAAMARLKAKDNNKGSGMLCARKGKKRRRKGTESGHSFRSVATSDESDEEEILTYEEVALYYPNSLKKRPIVLIGPPNIGRHELRQRLMSDSERFAAAIPHTSRMRRDGEVPGQDYHFITKEQFEADILARRFVEHGEYEKAYYGTSLEAIRKVITDGKICVLNLHPQSLKLLRASDIKPYVVFVAPPSLEKLRQKTLGMGDSGKEENLKDIIATARDMEARWGHLFDMIIINNDTEKAYHQLLAEINSLEREPQWVPAIWLVNERADL
ncbi:uncharacterized protein LOC129611287 [Condylostylus longicornis]|uniref:uncharacterized protein LOC129611287 n=1 Tax=Condylostylus longicornis TaxID=2530218 RepID=UPI00244DCD7B|nr:uncharacterized protein LOC129611287 [Condylostylus longicornis]